MKNIYYALNNSYIRYGLFAWGNASFETLKPIRALTNRALRIMSFAPFGRLDVQPIYEHFNILDVDKWGKLKPGRDRQTTGDVYRYSIRNMNFPQQGLGLGVG